jgi:hypothetical protein
VKSDDQVLQHELSLAFEFKGVSNSIPFLVVVVPADLVPKTEPRMIAAMTAAINEPIGMMNLFLRYQGRLENVMKSPVKNALR